MPDSDKLPKFQDQDSPPSPAGSDILRYRRIIIIGSHILAFALSLLLSFLVTSNMQFRLSWLSGQFPQLLIAFIVIKLVIFAFLSSSAAGGDTPEYLIL